MAEYKKMANLINSHKEELLKQLVGLSLPSESEKIRHLCMEYIDKLTSKEAEYMLQLSLLEQDILSPILTIIDSLYSSSMSPHPEVQSSTQKEERENQRNSTTKKYETTLAGIVGGTLLATICKPSSWGVILLGSIISAVIDKTLVSLYHNKNHNNEISTKKASNHYLTPKDAENIINELITIGECLDKVLLTYRRHLAIVQDEYEHRITNFNLDKKYIGVLECYQMVLGNLISMDPSPIVRDTIKQLNKSLSYQGYKAVHFSEELKNLFDVKVGDCKHAEEFKPAILKINNEKDFLILKGEVVLPK